MPSVRNPFQMASLGALPLSNNNPFALIDDTPSAWQGLVPGSTGFLKFINPMYGTRAGFINLVNRYLNQGLNTIEKIFPVYAPAGHGSNNPANYIASVERITGIPRNRVISSSEDLYKLGKAIVQVEEGKFWVPIADFDEGFRQAMINRNITIAAKVGGISLGTIAVGVGIWYFFFRKNKKAKA